MAPFSLINYEDARPWARSIKDKVVSRYMPPGHLHRTIGEYSPDPSLSDAEVETIARWVDTGAPRGDAKDAPKPRVFAATDTWQFGEEPDLIVTSPPITIQSIERARQEAESARRAAAEARDAEATIAAEAAGGTGAEAHAGIAATIVDAFAEQLARSQDDAERDEAEIFARMRADLAAIGQAAVVPGDFPSGLPG